jgi:uncharacterized protein (TIGR01777 family)
MTRKNILITGASGLIGTRLTELLLQKGHQVSHLGRKAGQGSEPSFVWDVTAQTMDGKSLHGIDTIVHLAGAGVADKPWTKRRKQEILDSRVLSTQLLYKTLSENKHAVTSFISASAIGYYGFERGHELLTESSSPGSDFLATVTQQWEEAIDKLQELSLRVAKLRIGIVLSEKGGALKPLVTPVKLFIGSPIGTGEQMLSWIHIDDLCAMFVYLIENEGLNGAYNGTGPEAVSNRDFVKAIGRVLHRPVFMPKVPSFAIRMLLGEMADLVLKGSRVSSQKIQNSGFSFQFKTLDECLQNLLVRA